MLCVSVQAWAGVAGQVIFLSGTLSAKKADASSRLLAVQSKFDDGDILGTTQGSFARIRFIDGTEIAMRPNTSLDIREISYKEAEPTADRFAVGLLKGGMRTVTGLVGKRSKERVRYDTPAGTIGIRGTHFGLLFCQADDCNNIHDLKGKALRGGLHADVAQGSIAISNRAGSVIVDVGHFAYVADADTAPLLADEDEPFRVILPASVLFDEQAQVWSNNVKCDHCAMH